LHSGVICHISLPEETMIRRLIPVWIALAFALFLPAIAAAQSGHVIGQILDRDAKPWPGVTIVLKSDSGRTFTVKTDKDGRFSQIGLTPGIYTFTYSFSGATPGDSLNYADQHQVVAESDTTVNINFKTILEQQKAAHPEQQQAQQEAANQFKGMKAHVDAGVAALSDSEDLRKQLKAAPADQKSAIQEKLNADYQTAVTELQAAEQAVGAKDTKNHAVIWSNLGVAYNLSGKYEDGANAYQKAIDLNPQASYYTGLSSALANSAAALSDQAAISAKIAEAGADCDKATALDPTPGASARCWKNIGIVLTNKGNLKDAVAPLIKSTQMDPKDAQTWYLLGSAYTGMIDSKQEGDKLTYIIPPGTADSYQKCIDADPTGPYAAQCKTMIDSLTAMGAGESTMVGTKKQPSKKK
jgi:tetratricopeptide (TPR) repeat protein